MRFEPVHYVWAIPAGWHLFKTTACALHGYYTGVYGFFRADDGSRFEATSIPERVTCPYCLQSLRPR